MSKDTKKNNIIQKNEKNNIEKNNIIQKNNIHYFNKLALRDHTIKHNNNGGFETDHVIKHSNNGSFSNSIEKLRKRAKAKNFTFYYLKHLLELNSKLKKSYNKTISCSSVLEQQNNKLITHFCRQRWCIVCNRIKIATLINSYSDNLLKLGNNLYFVTLTIRNVEANNLKETIINMNKVFAKILKKFRTKKIKVKLIKKLEVTYNPSRNDYHPHLHLLVHTYKHAKFIHDQWIKYNSINCNKVAQNIKKADKNFLELFKYFSKIITNKVIYTKALDIIYMATKNLKVFKAVNISKSNNNNIDINDINIETNEQLWIWDSFDWYGKETGKALTNNKPTELINLIKIKNF